MVSHSLATSHMILGNLKEFVGQIRYKFHPARSGSTLRSSPRWTCLEYLYRKVPGKNPNQIPEPPQLAALNVKEQFHSELCPDIPEGCVLARILRSDTHHDTIMERNYHIMATSVTFVGSRRSK